MKIDDFANFAYPFWRRQVEAWKTYNQNTTHPPAPPPPDDNEGTQASYCNFIGNINGGQSSPTSNQGPDHWYGDAILMRYYAAGPGTQYIKFNSALGRWDYDQRTKLTFKDNNGNPYTIWSLPIWEFCTCSSASTCQNSSPQ